MHSHKRIVLVTGANKGIGLETARQLAQAGHTVLLGARDHHKGAAAAAKLDLNTPEGANAAARRIQCSSKDGEPTVYWFHGEGFSRVPGERDRKLFNVEA